MTDLPTKTIEPVIGRADVLLRFLQLTGQDRPQDIDEYLADLDADTERRPIVDQIVDRIIAGDRQRYELYAQARREVGPRNPYASAEDSDLARSRGQALGAFMMQWIVLENVLRRIVGQTQDSERQLVFPTSKLLQKVHWLSDEERREINYLRQLRNQVVHGIDAPNEAQLLDAARSVERVSLELQSRSNNLSQRE